MIGKPFDGIDPFYDPSHDRAAAYLAPGDDPFNARWPTSPATRREFHLASETTEQPDAGEREAALAALIRGFK